MIETPQILVTAPQLLAIVHLEIPRSKMQQLMGPAIGEVMAAVKAQGVGPAGPWFAHHLQMAPDRFTFDICVPVSAPLTPVGRVQAGLRPALRVVRTVYSGPYEGLGSAWNEFAAWREANRCETTSDLYECYLVGPQTSPDSTTWRTELTKALVE